MKSHLQHLDTLLDYLPSSSSCRGFSDLHIILSKYMKILNSVNSYDENYKRATSLYYNSINLIKDDIELSVNSETPEEKSDAFNRARVKLKKDIQALCTLVRPHEEMVEFAF